jgi:hypothetical protein
MNILRFGRSKHARKDDSTEASGLEEGSSISKNERAVSGSEFGRKTEMESIDEDYARRKDERQEGMERYEENSDKVESVILEISLAPATSEKCALFPILHELRQDSTFCDVAFLCHGTLFTAHRCVVSRLIKISCVTNV